MRALLLASLVSACARLAPGAPVASRATLAPTSAPAPAGAPTRAHPQEGIATYYADALHGRATASGEPYDKRDKTCAHRSLPFQTRLVIERIDTGKTAVCRVNDRGPFGKGRVVDVSRALAEELEIVQAGKARVRVWVE